MANTVSVQAHQVSSTTTLGTARGHEVLIDRPEAKEGTDKGAMGGELLLLALGGCFMSNLLAAIRAREAQVSDIEVEIVGTMGTAPARFTAIELQITGTYQDADLMEKLVTIAERGCLVANSIKGAIDLSFSIAQKA